MSCWEILGIAPTGDTRAIRSAFSAQSKLHHPEDDPEGFQRLREAYRLALRLAEAWSARFRPEPETPDRPEREEKPGDEPEIQPPRELETPNFNAFETRDDQIKRKFHLLDTEYGEPPESPGPSMPERYNFESVERIVLPEENLPPRIPVPPPQTTLTRAGRPFQPGVKRKRSPLKTGGLVLGVYVLIVVFVIALAPVYIERNPMSTYSYSPTTLLNSSPMHSSVQQPYDSPFITMAGDDTANRVKLLKEQARDILSSQDENCTAALKSIAVGATYSENPAAVALHIDEPEYDSLLSDYLKLGEQKVKSELDKKRKDEKIFVLNTLLPIIKTGIISGWQTPEFTDLCSMVGITQERYTSLWQQYLQDHKEGELDLHLIKFDDLLLPDFWKNTADTG